MVASYEDDLLTVNDMAALSAGRLNLGDSDYVLDASCAENMSASERMWLGNLPSPESGATDYFGRRGSDLPDGRTANDGYHG
jgi:hypothetical protein